MKLSVAIMAHPARKARAEALESELGALPFTAVQIIYNELGEEVTPHEREWDTGRRCLEWGIGKADWHLIIQDDAILTPFFYENVASAIEALPQKSLLSFYTGQARPWPRRVSHAVSKAADGDFLQFHLLVWGVGFAIPTDHIPATLEFAEGREEPYDTRIGMMYHGNMLPVYYTMPSLVDHDDETGSLLGHGILPGARIAHRPARGLVEFTGKVIDM